MARAKKGRKAKTKSAKRSKSASRRKVAAPRLSPVPRDLGTVTPYLTINGAATALEFYKKAFGAKEISRQPLPNGKLMHARIKIGDSTLFLSDEFEGSELKAPSSLGASTVTLHVYSKDVDKLWQQALDAGARVVMPLENTFWGERYGQLADPFGHRWSLSMQIRMSKEEMEEKQKQAMEMFSGGQQQPPAEQPGPELVQQEEEVVQEAPPTENFGTES